MIRRGFALALLASVAFAQSPDEIWERALAAEADADPRRARRHYVELRETAPGTRLALRAERRIEWIDQRLDGPLEEVLRARSTPTDRAALERLEAALDEAPSSVVVREGWTVLARSWERMGETRRAIRAYRRWMDLATGPERRRAASGLAHLLERSGDSGGADELIDGEQLEESADEIAAIRLRRTARIGAGVMLGVHLVLLFVMVRLERWQRLLDPRLLLVLVVLTVPALLAGAYDPASWDSFLWLLATSIPLLALAVLAGASAPSRTRRRALAVSACVAQLALGVLVYTR